MCLSRANGSTVYAVFRTTETVLFHEQRGAVCFASRGVFKRGRGCSLPKPPKLKFIKNKDFVDKIISNVLHDLPFSRNQ